MKKNDLKTLIKPLVKECIHEVLIEEGLLSNVVAEVAKGMQGNLVVESKSAPPPPRKASSNKIKEHRAKLMNSINAEAYNGIDLFEGTEPMNGYESSEPKAGSVDLGNPRDSGVDISSLIGGAGKIWDAMK
jgi:hypothetical protein|tara:strand:+ start:327 stop:719 length:393 start_codon:yes stop_codon:yes gene_type:complete